MEYDFRNRGGPPYTSSAPPPPQPSSHLMYGQPPGRHHSFHQSPPPSASPSSGIGIRVAIKPDYRITPPPQLSQQTGDIPQSNFHFDFDLERKILIEAEKENSNWSRLLELENLPSKRTESAPSVHIATRLRQQAFTAWSYKLLNKGNATDPIVSKYIGSGLSREAVPIAVANYGDNPTKVKEFVNGYTLLREMGFLSNSVAEALLMCDNDTDKALAHILRNPS